MLHRIGGLGRHGVREVLALGVEPSAGRDQVGIVRRRHHRDRTGRTGVEVAQVVGQTLELVRRELVVVLQDLVVGRARGSEEARVALDVEIELERVDNRRVHTGARVAVATSVGSCGAHREEAGVVALLDHDKSDVWLVIDVEAAAAGAQRGDLGLEDVGKLALRDAVAVDQDALGLLSTAKNYNVIKSTGKNNSEPLLFWRLLCSMCRINWSDARLTSDSTP